MDCRPACFGASLVPSYAIALATLQRKRGWRDFLKTVPSRVEIDCCALLQYTTSQTIHPNTSTVVCMCSLLTVSTAAASLKCWCCMIEICLLSSHIPLTSSNLSPCTFNAQLYGWNQGSWRMILMESCKCSASLGGM